MSQLLRVLVALLGFAVPALAGNWPAWRGPDGTGHSPEKDLPIHWSATDNVRWKAPLPDAGNSSPIIWGERVFLTQATDKGSRRAVLCFDRKDGKLLWQRETEFTGKESTYTGDPHYCSATPVTDGERVIASLGSAGMVCYDFAGQELWRKDLGRLEHIWGNASSPILYGDLAILWCGPGERQFLLAVNKRNGETVWEHQEPGGNAGADSKEWHGSWSTPIIVKVDGRDELILAVPEKLKGFDPKTGKEIWSCSGLGRLVYTSPVYSNGILVIMSGFHGAAMAVRVGGKGDVTDTHRLWHHPPRTPQRVGSPVLAGEHVYILNDNGQAQCFELRTGKELWNQQRLSSRGRNWGSMVAAGDRLYITDSGGDTFVLAANPRFEQIAKNPIQERVLATIAVADGELFIRSHRHLWCIGEKK
jgi:outer membrane protein assembly factor BamB